jgi:hypothetical protein
MSKVSFLDWGLVVGVIVYGACLAIYFEKKYNFRWHYFLMVTFYVATLAAILIGTYQVIRTTYLLP